MFTLIRPMQLRPLLAVATGGFPVPGALAPAQLPATVRASMMRPLAGPPKPSVTAGVMNATQFSMIAPDLPYRADV